MTDDKKKTTPPTTHTPPRDERAPAMAEERKLAVDDVEAGDGEGVKGGAISLNGTIFTGATSDFSTTG